MSGRIVRAYPGAPAAAARHSLVRAVLAAGLAGLGLGLVLGWRRG